MMQAPAKQQSLFLANEDATIAFAAKIAPLLKSGDCVLLSGDLGMGKSTFARAVIRARLDDPEMEVPSPTFTLVQVYEAETPVFHFDLYRLGDSSELAELGLDEALDEGISLIEWPEQGEGFLPSNAILLSFREEGEGRRLSFNGPQDRIKELQPAL